MFPPLRGAVPKIKNDAESAKAKINRIDRKFLWDDIACRVIRPLAMEEVQIGGYSESGYQEK